jgi:hypothetical protein
MKRYRIHRSPYFYAANPEINKYISEKHPNARFIEEISIRNTHGGYTPNPAIVLYEKNPPKGYSEYFAYFRYPDNAYLVSGLSTQTPWVVVGLKDFDPIVPAILVPTEEGGVLTISRFGHDYVSSPVGDAAIDGGREYTRILGTPRPQTVAFNLHTQTFELNGEIYHVAA